MTDARDAIRAYEVQPQHGYAGHSRRHSAPRAFDALRSLLDLADQWDAKASKDIEKGFLAAGTQYQVMAMDARNAIKEALSDG